MRLLTVHGAKGLEARGVVLLDTDTPERAAETMSVLVDWPGHLPLPQRLVFLASERAPPACADGLLAIDLATQAVRWKVKTGKTPADIFLTADDRTLLVGLTGDKFVEAYDVGGAAGALPKLIKRIETGKGAHAFRARGDKRHVFVSNRVANTISLIDTQTLSVVGDYPGPGGPDCMEVLADGQTLLVTSRWARKLTFIDLPSKKVLRQIDVGRSPHGVWTLDHAGRQ